MSVAFIALLSRPVAPPAIFRRVRRIVIDAIQRLAWRRLSHISDKVRVIMPPITNDNTSGAIIFILRKIFVIASLFHAAPDFITSWVLFFVSTVCRRPMRQIHSLVIRFFIASARCRMAFNQITSQNYRRSSAFTFTKPSGFSFNIIG